MVIPSPPQKVHPSHPRVGKFEQGLLNFPPPLMNPGGKTPHKSAKLFAPRSPPTLTTHYEITSHGHRYALRQPCNLIPSSFNRLCPIDVRREADRSRMSVLQRQPFEIANNPGDAIHIVDPSNEILFLERYLSNWSMLVWCVEKSLRKWSNFFFENVKKYLFEYRSNIFLSRLNNFYIDVYYFIFNFDLLEFVEIVD